MQACYLRPCLSLAGRGIPRIVLAGLVLFLISPVMVRPDGSDYHRLTNLKFGGSHVRWIPPVKK